MKGKSIAGLCFAIVLGMGGPAQAQNLVPNPSFEEYTNCPPTYGYWSYIVGWTSYYTLSADYFNRCADGGEPDVPLSGFGYQEPASGDAYTGMVTYQFFSEGESYYREFLGTQLTEPLQPGVPVYLSFKASPGAFGSSHWSSMRWVSKNIGIKFFIDPPVTGVDWQYWLYPNTSALHLEEVLNDTSAWVTVSGVYVPDSAYTRLILGNFFADSLSAPELIDPSGGFDGAYAFVDEVCVSYAPGDCGSIGMDEVRRPTVRSVTNPFSNQLVLRLSSPSTATYSLYLNDQLGRICLESSWPRGIAEVSLETSGLSPGTYSLNLENQMGRLKPIVLVHVSP